MSWNEFDDTPELRKAINDLHWALDDGYANQQVDAIDALIVLRMEMLEAKLKADILKAREEERTALFDRFSAQLAGWDQTPPEEGENYGSMALANALWQIFPEFRSQLQDMNPDASAIRQHSQKGEK